MVIDNRNLHSDVMIYPDGRVEDNWRRIAGHRLEAADIGQLLTSSPSILVVGTGIYGRMHIQPDLESYVKTNGIELVVKRTEQAAETFNQLKQAGLNVAGCFHLTC